MKITLAICTNRQVKPKTVESLLNLVSHSKELDIHILIAQQGYTIAENRNYCVVEAQKNESDYLFFVDDDMTFPHDTLEKLLAHKKEIIGVNSYSRVLPLSSTVGLMDKEGEYMHPSKHTEWAMTIPKELFKAYFVGTGVMLIDMKVFDKIEKPYFGFEVADNGMVLHGEDGSFCEKAKKAGIDIWCEPKLDVGHIGEYVYSRPEDKPLFVEK